MNSLGKTAVSLSLLITFSHFYLIKRMITTLVTGMSLSCCHLASTCIIRCRISGCEQSLPRRYRILTSEVEYKGMS